MSQPYRIAFASLVVLLACYTAALFPPNFLHGFASSFTDQYYRFNRHSAPENLVFLDVENTSVREFGRWPWPREIIGQGLSQLHQAEVVGLDVLFSEQTNSSSDAQLALALAEIPAISGFFLNGPVHSTLDEQAWEDLAHSALYQYTPPQLLGSQNVELSIAPIREQAQLLAALNIAPDPDQLFRRYPLAFQMNDLVVPNLATQMWRFVQQQDLQGKEQPLLGDMPLATDNQGRLLLNFYPQNSWQSIPFVRLFDENFDPSSLAGKWVIVGISEAGVSDLRATPLGQMFGPLIHLTMLGNWLDGSHLSAIQGVPLLAVFIVLWLVLLLCWQLQSPVVRLLLYVLVLSATVIGAVLAYRWYFLWLDLLYPLLFVMLSAALGETWLFIKSRAESSFIRNAFGSYVAPSLVQQIVEQGSELKLGGHKQTTTVLFTDLRDFTPTTEALETSELVSHLNQYFGLMIDQLHQYQGTLDKLMGDAIMAFFNAPLADEQHEYHACMAAVAMMHSLQRFNQQFPENDVRRLRMGIGINTGESIVGNIGAAGRFNYTTIGDSVNVAARLESATKEVNQRWQTLPENERPIAQIDILLGERTYLAVKDRLPCYPVGELELKGKSQGLPAWALDWQAITL